MTRGMKEIVGDEVARVFGELILRQECDAAENERGAYGSERHTPYDLQCRVQALERDTDAKRGLSDILPLPHETQSLRSRGNILGTSWPVADRRDNIGAVSLERSSAGPVHPYRSVASVSANRRPCSGSTASRLETWSPRASVR